MPTLSTNRYLFVGTYIGQFIQPRSVQLTGEARLPAGIGRGSRLAQVFNSELLRSFVPQEELSFPPTAPFVASLTYDSNGAQDSPVSLYKSNGETVRPDQYQFLESGGAGTGYDQVLIRTEVFDQTATYFIDYQSTDRNVLDSLPVDDLREVRAIGDQIDQEKYLEFEDYYIPMIFSSVTPDAGNVLAASSVQTPIKTAGSGVNTTVTQHSSSAFNHNYNRLYNVNCTAITGTQVGGDRTATFEYTATPTSGGNFAFAPSPLHSSAPANSFTIDETVAASLQQTIELGIVLEFTFGAAGGDHYANDDTFEFMALGPALVEVDVKHLNDNETLEFGTILGDTGNTGTGVLAHSASTDYTGDANIGFNLQCIASAGIVGARTATMVWSSFRELGANGTFVLDEAVPISLTQTLEKGVKLDFTFGALNFDSGDEFGFLVDVPFAFVFHKDDRNYTLSITSSTNPTTTSGHIDLTYSVDTPEGGFGVAAADVAVPIAGVRSSGTVTITDNTFDVNDAIVVGGEGFTEGVAWSAGASIADSATNLAAAIDASANFIASAVGPIVTIQYVNTGVIGDAITLVEIDGATNNFTLSGANLASGIDEVVTAIGRITLPDNVTLLARNMLYGGSQTGNNHEVNDKHTFSTNLSDVIDFSLTSAATDERDPDNTDDVLLDVTGAITGIANTYYSILSFIPLLDLDATDSNGSVTITQVADAPYVYYNSKPTETVAIAYRHRGQEPAPSQTYYFTANYLRPDEFYNSIQIVSSLEEGRRLFGPAAQDNHVYLANEIAWAQPGNLEAVAFIQVKDADGDSVHTKTDYQAAISAAEDSSLITDRTLLGFHNGLSDLLASNIKLSDPFKGREHLIWIGAPIGTPVGSIDVEDSLVFLSRKTLQVFGDSPAHGTRILVSPTYVDKSLKLQDGTDVVVRLDGSFYAFAQACKTAGFTDTADTILLTNDAGFDDVEVHTEAERIRLGGANIVFPEREGDGIFRVKEDVTVDKFAPDFENINAMVQKQDVTRAVRTAMTSALIAIKVTSGEAAIGIIAGVLSRILQGLKTQGRIADWQDESGNIRPFDPAKDIRVYRDSDNPTQFAFFYNYFLTYVIKRLLGLYSVDTAKLDLPPSGDSSTV